MFILKLFRKGRSSKDVSIGHSIFCVLLISLSIYLWKLLRCPGFPKCHICLPYSPDRILYPSIFSPSATDFVRLMDLPNFTFLTNNFVCNYSKSGLLVLVHSAPENFDKRRTIRETWGGLASDKYKLLFLLGIPKGAEAQARLDKENEATRDLVQGNFVDTYRNLTYKHVMALKWTKYFCPNAKYLLKTDDDVFVNLPGILNFVDTPSALLPRTKLMWCLPTYGGKAKRSYRSKWRVTWSEYRFRQFPPYCQGFAILYSLDVVTTLYAMAQIADYFWIDDVFITGLLASSGNFTPSTFGKFILTPDDLDGFLNQDSISFSHLLGPWNLRADDIRKLWKRALKVNQDQISSQVKS